MNLKIVLAVVTAVSLFALFPGTNIIKFIVTRPGRMIELYLCDIRGFRIFARHFGAMTAAVPRVLRFNINTT